MISKTAKGVTIEIDEEDLLKSIARLNDLRDFLDTLHTVNDAAELRKHLTVAIETMMGFWREHFKERVEVDG